MSKNVKIVLNFLPDFSCVFLVSQGAHNMRSSELKIGIKGVRDKTWCTLWPSLLFLKHTFISILRFEGV